MFTIHREELPKIKMTGMQTMARYMWLPFFAMGAMIVVAALGIGAVASNFAADLNELPKGLREATTASGSTLDKQQFVETTKIWLPAFQLLGMGVMFGGITFLLATILGNLRVYGGQVQAASGRRVLGLTTPWSGRLFPMLMMLGVMILIANLIIAVAVAVLANGVYAHPIAEINAAASGSVLLDNFQTVQTYNAWLAPFGFVGLGLVLTGIVLALYTIIQVLRFQHTRVAELAEGKE
jgi:hypothetical protein